MQTLRQIRARSPHIYISRGDDQLPGAAEPQQRRRGCAARTPCPQRGHGWPVYHFDDRPKEQRATCAWEGKTKKAARIHEFGPPGVIVIDDVPRPAPSDGEAPVIPRASDQVCQRNLG